MYVLRFACTVYACYVAFPFVNICVFVRVLYIECYIPPCLLLFSGLCDAFNPLLGLESPLSFFRAARSGGRMVFPRL